MLFFALLKSNNSHLSCCLGTNFQKKNRHRKWLIYDAAYVYITVYKSNINDTTDILHLL